MVAVALIFAAPAAFAAMTNTAQAQRFQTEPDRHGAAHMAQPSHDCHDTSPSSPDSAAAECAACCCALAVPPAAPVVSRDVRRLAHVEPARAFDSVSQAPPAPPPRC
ncbi:MAG: hypothetical protein KDJ25_02175 [Rhodoblastus sp.]|nr:hypothetical protein [Rhodoblastus sp.]